MGTCERCGVEFQAYCSKCRDEIRQKETPAVVSEEVVTILAFDKKTALYRYGCSVSECPCNLQNGWCSKATPKIDKKMIKLMLNMLHEYDGDNCVKQWCG